MRELISSETLRAPISALRPSRPVCVEGDLPVSQAIELMKSKNIGCLLILVEGTLKGIFTERDVLVRVLARNRDAKKVMIREVMTENPECLQHEDMVAYALNRMSVGNYRHIPLVDEANRPVGIISVRDVFKHLVRPRR
ncbi:MAG: CBS domain-containing protein [Planctomycetes bacterium]|nr:CBS domain-containing protein [Planctomycetota bacterium]